MRYIIGITALVALIGGLAAIKTSQIKLLIQSGEAAKAAGPPPETVSTAQVTRDSWGSSISAVGSVEANRGVAIANDAPGVVTRIRFESGDEVKAGAVLVELDTRVERAQLASAEARRSLAETTLQRTTALVSSGVVAVEELDQASAALKTATADVAALQAQIARKVVRAPFSGRLSIRQVNLGQYLGPGTTLTTLQGRADDYVDFSISQQRLSEVELGLPVEFSIRGDESQIIKGTIVAINPQADSATRTVTLRAKTDDAGQALIPGMFVSASIQLPTQRDVVLVPAPAIVYASFGNSIFVVEEESKDGETRLIARQQFVRTGESRGDFVVIEEGLEGTEAVVTAGAFKLRNGARIVVNNDVEVGARLDPRPENR